MLVCPNRTTTVGLDCSINYEMSRTTDVLDSVEFSPWEQWMIKKTREDVEKKGRLKREMVCWHGHVYMHEANVYVGVCWGSQRDQEQIREGEYSHIQCS